MISQNIGKRIRWGGTEDSVYKAHRAKWEDRWKKNFSGLWIPEHQDGFDWLLVIPQGMTPNMAYDRLRAASIPVWRYTADLNTIFSGRFPNTDYTVWIRAGQEADEEWQGKSANDALALFVNGITITERLVAGEDYFLETGKHLDAQTITLCSGSRGPDGDVPRVNWRDSEVDVRWCGARYAGGAMRLREVVS